MATTTPGRPSTTTTSPTRSSVISSSRSTRLQTSSTSLSSTVLSMSSSSASRTSTTTRANVILSVNAPHPSQSDNTTREIMDTTSSYEVDAFATRAKGPSRVALAVGVALAILAVTGAFASLFLFLKSRRRRQTRPADLHSSAPSTRERVRPSSQRDPGQMDMRAERGTDGSRSFRVPRKPPPTIQALSTPELVSEQSEGITSSLTLPSTPRLQNSARGIDDPKTDVPGLNTLGVSVEPTSPIPIPGVHQHCTESVVSGYTTDSRPLYQRAHSVDHVHALASSTPTGPRHKLTTYPTSYSFSASLHEPFELYSGTGLASPTSGRHTPHFGTLPISRFERGPPSRTISDVSTSQDVKIGFVSNNFPLVYYPGSHEGAISARGSIHSEATHVIPGGITHRMRARSSSSSHPSLKKARSAEAMTVRKSGGGYETPQSVIPSRSRTPIRRPSRKKVPRRLIDELELEIGGPILVGPSTETRDNYFLNGPLSSPSVLIGETKGCSPRPRSSSHSRATTSMC